MEVGRGQAHHVGEAAHERAQPLVALVGHAQSVPHVGHFDVRLRHVDNRIDRPDGIVHFVGHHADALTIGRFFGFQNFAGEFLNQHERAGEAPVHEVRAAEFVGFQTADFDRPGFAAFER